MKTFKEYINEGTSYNTKISDYGKSLGQPKIKLSTEFDDPDGSVHKTNIIFEAAESTADGSIGVAIIIDGIDGYENLSTWLSPKEFNDLVTRLGKLTNL